MKSLNGRNLAIKNIRRKPFRSFMMILLISLFSFSLVVGIVISTSLSKGVSSLSDRLGADVMVVPEGYEAKIDSIILSGKAVNFYLPKDAYDKVKDIEGIDKITTQTYIATLSASCCSYPVQIVGIDYDTDFLIKPWLNKTMNIDLKKGEVIVGAHVTGEVNETVKFFGQPYQIAGRLEQTGMGFDATVFMTQETSAELAKDAQRIMKHKLSEDGSLVSTIMIKLKDGYDSTEVAREITEKYSDDGIYGMFSKKFVNEISSNLIVISRYIKIIISIILILAIIVIALVFSLSINERKKEFGIFRVIGMTKRQLASLIIRESFIVSLFASAIGIFIGLIAIISISPIVKDSLHIPFVIPSISLLLTYGLICFAISSLTGPIATFTSVYKIIKSDIYTNMKEGI